MSYFERRMKNYLGTREKMRQLDRETLVNRIEGITGSLKSVPWSKVTKEDLITLYMTLRACK